MPLPRRARMSILAAALAPRTGLETPETAATVNSTLPPDSVRAWPCAFVLADAHGTSHRLWQAAQQHHIGHKLQAPWRKCKSPIVSHRTSLVPTSRPLSYSASELVLETLGSDM